MQELRVFVNKRSMLYHAPCSIPLRTGLLVLFFGFVADTDQSEICDDKTAMSN